MVVAGDTVYIRSGLYVTSSTIQISSSKSGTDENRCHLLAFPKDTVIIDFYSQPFGERGISLRADYWIIKGLNIRNAGDNGMYIDGENNLIENCTFSGNDDSGLQISGGGAYNTIINCDSYNNADPDNEDLHLGACSRCIDAGNNGATDLPEFDFEGDERILDGNDDGTATVDMGMDEVAVSGTCFHVHSPVVLKVYE